MRGRAVQVELRQPHAVEAPCFGRLHEIEPFVERVGLAAALAVAELHKGAKIQVCLLPRRTGRARSAYLDAAGRAHDA